jgi:hypothetical protein
MSRILTSGPNMTPEDQQMLHRRKAEIDYRINIKV